MGLAPNPFHSAKNPHVSSMDALYVKEISYCVHLLKSPVKALLICRPQPGKSHSAAAEILCASPDNPNPLRLCQKLSQSRDAHAFKSVWSDLMEPAKPPVFNVWSVSFGQTRER
jgi:hypothetical protein